MLPPSQAECTEIAASMIAALEAELWPQRGHWLRNDKAPLSCRVGSGNATYFKPSSGGNQIVFGWKMVRDKCTADSSRWLSHREIVRHRYFDGDVKPLNLLAHTVCHEFAHYLQHGLGQRRRGQVHNQTFYGYLAELYKLGLAGGVKSFLLKQQPELGQLTVISAPVTQAATKANYRLGDKVSFYSGGVLQQGEVIRINRKTLSVRALSKRLGRRHQYWRVPYSLIT